MEDPADTIAEADHAFGQSAALTGRPFWCVAVRSPSPSGTGDLRGQRVADVGCGFEAIFPRSIIADVESLALVDVALSDDLIPSGESRPRRPPARCLAALPDASLDVVMCVSVLEHLWEPEVAFAEFHRILRRAACAWSTCPPGGGSGSWSFRLPARSQPGRRDRRPQAVLRPARPVAPAGASRVSPHSIRCTATSSA